MFTCSERHTVSRILAVATVAAWLLVAGVPQQGLSILHPLVWPLRFPLRKEGSNRLAGVGNETIERPCLWPPMALYTTSRVRFLRATRRCLRGCRL